MPHCAICVLGNLSVIPTSDPVGDGLEVLYVELDQFFFLLVIGQIGFPKYAPVFANSENQRFFSICDTATR